MGIEPSCKTPRILNGALPEPIKSENGAEYGVRPERILFREYSGGSEPGVMYQNLVADRYRGARY
jgi:hypothetical protein